ncbi:MAG: hypothetical protein WA139_02200 [Candidatus Aenigmatarchaeota archaeon]
MPFPHPRKIFMAIRIMVAIVFLLFGFAGVLYPAIIPQELVSLIPSEMFSISRDNMILVFAFVSMILGFILLSRKENF